MCEFPVLRVCVNEDGVCGVRLGDVGDAQAR